MRKREEPSEAELLQRQEENKVLLTAEVGALNIQSNKLKGEIAELNKQISALKSDFDAKNVVKIKLNEEIEAIKKVKQEEENKLFDELNQKIKETDGIKLELNKLIEENKVSSEILAVSQADLALKQREIDLAMKDISEREEALKGEYIKLDEYKNKAQLDIFNRENELAKYESTIKLKEEELNKISAIQHSQAGLLAEDKLNIIKEKDIINAKNQEIENKIAELKELEKVKADLDLIRSNLAQKEQEIEMRIRMVKDNEKSLNNRIKQFNELKNFKGE